MKPLKIFIGEYIYFPKYRSFLVDILKPLIPEKNLKKYQLSHLPIEIVQSGSDSDCYLLPFCWNYYLETGSISVARRLIREARETKKKILIWVTGDYYYSIPRFDNIIGLYSSPYQSKQNVTTIPLPVIIRDPLTILNKKKISQSDLNSQPSIGFCGQSDPNLIISSIKMTKLVWQNIRFYFHLSKYYSGPVTPPTFLRKKVLDIINKTDIIHSEFIRRNRYHGGEFKKADSINRLRKEFYKNIENTNYTLCIRGTGNFSTRFYETLALGRIPIFINTDCILPFSGIIEWKKFVVWIELNDILNINTILLDFHKGLTQYSLTNLQEKNRKLWEDFFSFPGFIHHLIYQIKNELN